MTLQYKRTESKMQRYTGKSRKKTSDCGRQQAAGPGKSVISLCKKVFCRRNNERVLKKSPEQERDVCSGLAAQVPGNPSEVKNCKFFQQSPP